MPYLVPMGSLVMFGRRGDIISKDPRSTGQRDGMIGFLDTLDWFGVPVWLSDFTLKRMFVAIVPRSWKPALIASQCSNVDIKGKEIPESGYLDYATYTSLKTVDGKIISNPSSLIHSPEKNPVWDFTKESLTDIKDATKRDWEKTLALIDFHLVSSGAFTYGSGGGDDYPTLSGVAGGVADMDDLTGALSFTASTATTEASDVNTNGHAMGNHVLTLDGNSGHLGDPTAGLKSTVTTEGLFITIRQCTAGTGSVVVKDFNIYCNPASGDCDAAVTYLQNGTASPSPAYFSDLLIDGNAKCKRCMDILPVNNSPVSTWKNIVAWDASSTGVCHLEFSNGTHTFENVVTHDGAGSGFQITGGNVAGIILNNCGSCDNAGLDYTGAANATGNYNSCSDTSGENGDWGAGGVGNIASQTTSACVDSVDDTNSNFFKVTALGPWDGTGTTNTLTRPFGIRGNAVPGPNGTSIGASEIPSAGGSAFFPIFNSMNNQGAF